MPIRLQPDLLRKLSRQRRDHARRLGESLVERGHELVMQITRDAESLSKYTDITVVSLVGGMDYEKQKSQLRKPVDIVAATPGRLLDFARSGAIDLSAVEILIIDEADRMFDVLMGEAVGPRKRYIQSHSNEAELDI